MPIFRTRTWRLALVLPFRRGGRRRPAILLAGLVVILGWQLPHLQWPDKLDAHYQALASKGLDYENHFVYFLYYLGLYPVASKAEWPPKDYSEAGARRLLERAPDKLVQDLRFTFYSGERGKPLLYLFDAWLKGAPRDPVVRPFHRLVWMLTLCGLWIAFWSLRRPLVGGLFVGLFGSNPFALHSVIADENIHCWPVLSAGIVLALSLPFFGPAPPGRRLRWVLPVVTGILIGSMRTIRTEPTLMILAAALVYLAAGGLAWRIRVALVAVLAASFTLTYRGWEAWFDAKDREAKAVLARLGGHPYPQAHLQGHQIWHPIWCGLGDFDRKYGYQWRDGAALAYAKPILKQRGIIVTDFFEKDARFLDAAHLYPDFYSMVPEYTEVIRDKVVHDVTHDPVWYAGILLHRAWRLLDETPPVRLTAGFHHVPLPMHGLVLIPLALLLWRARSGFALRLLLFTLPTCITPFIIYSGDGMSYYALYPVAAAAILLAVLCNTLRLWRRSYGKSQMIESPKSLHTVPGAH